MESLGGNGKKLHEINLVSNYGYREIIEYILDLDGIPTATNWNNKLLAHTL